MKFKTFAINHLAKIGIAASEWADKVWMSVVGATLIILFAVTLALLAAVLAIYNAITERKDFKFLTDLFGLFVILPTVVVGLMRLSKYGKRSKASVVNRKTSFVSVAAGECRFCGGDVRPNASKCRHCGEWLQGTRRDQRAAPIRKVGCAAPGLIGSAIITAILYFAVPSLFGPGMSWSDAKVVMKRMEGHYVAVDATHVPWTNHEYIRLSTENGEYMHVYYPGEYNFGDIPKQSVVELDKAGDTYLQGKWLDDDDHAHDKQQVRVELRSDGILDINGDQFRRAK